jgi:hypothetical protein
MFARFAELPRLRFLCHLVQQLTTLFAISRLFFLQQTPLLVTSGIMHRKHTVGKFPGQTMEQ